MKKKNLIKLNSFNASKVTREKSHLLGFAFEMTNDQITNFTEVVNSNNILNVNNMYNVNSIYNSLLSLNIDNITNFMLEKVKEKFTVIENVTNLVKKVNKKYRYFFITTNFDNNTCSDFKEFKFIEDFPKIEFKIKPKDKFIPNDGINPRLKHIIKPRKPDPILRAYKAMLEAIRIMLITAGNIKDIIENIAKVLVAMIRIIYIYLLKLWKRLKKYFKDFNDFLKSFWRFLKKLPFIGLIIELIDRLISKPNILVFGVLVPLILFLIKDILKLKKAIKEANARNSDYMSYQREFMRLIGSLKQHIEIAFDVLKKRKFDSSVNSKEDQFMIGEILKRCLDEILVVISELPWYLRPRTNKEEGDRIFEEINKEIRNQIKKEKSTLTKENIEKDVEKKTILNEKASNTKNVIQEPKKPINPKKKINLKDSVQKKTLLGKDLGKKPVSGKKAEKKSMFNQIKNQKPTR